MPAKDTDRYNKTMAELAEEAHDVGIPFVEHMSFSELIEAIEQQGETNAVYAPEPRRPRQAEEEAPDERPSDHVGRRGASCIGPAAFEGPSDMTSGTPGQPGRERIAGACRRGRGPPHRHRPTHPRPTHSRRDRRWRSGPRGVPARVCNSCGARGPGPKSPRRSTRRSHR